jgi:8-oxo-dGTP diphosphatase
VAHTIAGVMIRDKDRYLLVQEKLEKCYGQWNWPAGWVDQGETPEKAAVREVKEEVGLDVELGEKIGEWYDEDAERTRILFLAKNFSGTVTLQESEILGVAWLSKDQMMALRDSMRVVDWSSDLLAEREQ